MGTNYELNSILKLTKEQGFPEILDVERHHQHPDNIKYDLYKMFGKFDILFNFQKSGNRMYLEEPNTMPLVQKMDDGKEVYWGDVTILRRERDTKEDITKGIFRLDRLYAPDFQKVETYVHARENSYFQSPSLAGPMVFNLEELANP